MKEVADIVFCEREKTNKKINVKIVCNTEMQELNKTFRNKDKNTNVLAFVNDDESKEQTREGTGRKRSADEGRVRRR